MVPCICLFAFSGQILQAFISGGIGSPLATSIQKTMLSLTQTSPFSDSEFYIFRLYLCLIYLKAVNPHICQAFRQGSITKCAFSLQKTWSSSFVSSHGFMQSSILCPKEGNVVECHKDGLSPHYEISEENDFPLPHWTIVKNIKKYFLLQRGLIWAVSLKTREGWQFYKILPRAIISFNVWGV